MLVRIWPRWCFLIAPGLRVLGLFYGGDNYCDSGGAQALSADNFAAIFTALHNQGFPLPAATGPGQ